MTSGTLAGNCDRTVSVQATPASGYSFLAWSDEQTGAVRFVTVSEPSQTLVATFALAVDPQRVVDQLVSCLLLPACELTSDERLFADRIGNRNGVVDVGDLLALVDAGAAAGLFRERMLEVLSSPRAGRMRIPVTMGKGPP